MRKTRGLVVWLALCFLAAGASLTSRPDIWYRGLNHPRITPPDAVFGLVWTMLYVSMALAAWLVWKQDGSARVFYILFPSSSLGTPIRQAPLGKRRECGHHHLQTIIAEQCRVNWVS